MKKTIFLFAPLIILASVIRAQSSSTDLASAAVAKLDKAKKSMAALLLCRILQRKNWLVKAGRS